jgi:putative spermidine/putrescine transport system substrate-binding protein
MTDRREVLSLIAGVAVGAMLAPVSVLAADRKILQVYTDGDTNVTDFFANTVLPAFEAAFPDLTFKLTLTRGVANENVTIAERTLAALQTKTDPKADYFEELEPRSVKGGLEAGLFAKLTPANVPNLAMANPASADLDVRLPYRGSQVLIAYDGAKIPTDKAPRTFADLVAWVKANPGRFIYGRPDKGGSGHNFVVRALHEANGRDPSLFRRDNFEPAKAEAAFQKAWVLLREIHPYTYGNGAYPAGNTPTLQLLAQGAVDMISAWSDQALQALKSEVLPATVKLLQFSDLALCGGFAYSAIPANATHLDGALKLANFMMSKEMQTAVVREIGGFPGVTWESLDPALRKEYIDIIPVSIPTFPDGDWSKALNAGWYKNVATNLSQ